MEITGAEIVVRCLQEEGVEHLFGYPGGVGNVTLMGEQDHDTKGWDRGQTRSSD